MKVVVIKYNSGNTCSVAFALERLGIFPTISDKPEDIQGADKIIFPGVGEAGSAMEYLKERKLDMLIASLKQPVLGICLGMQLMCKHSEEGNTSCLGIFNQEIKRFEPGLKVPHVGWNTVRNLNTPLFKGIEEEAYMYFVHSFYAENAEGTVASTDYGVSFSSALQKDNFYGVQFHPEKSGATGQKVLDNFLALKTGRAGV
jgi:glutamine amidotransferase